MEKQISIIIPTYNMEKYLGKCLDSLLIPEIDAIEVIVVNDGSKDRSLEIACDFVKRYPNSIRIINKTNGNYGSCINAALPTVKGRYIKVLDADDYFDKQAFSSFVRNLSNIDVDVILTRCREVDEQGSTIYISGKFKNVKYNKVYENINNYMPNNTLMHWITYNHKVFERFKYVQPEGVSYTDNIWAFIPIIFCHTGIFINMILYQYLLGREGQTMSPALLSQRIPHLIAVADCMADYYVKFSGKPTISRTLLRNCVAVITCIYNRIMSHRSEQNMAYLRNFDTGLQAKAKDLYQAIGEYNIHKGIHYKIYQELRKANYNFHFKVPGIIMLRRNFKLHIHAMNLKISRLFRSKC